MGISSNLLNAPKEFLILFKAGKKAAREGDNAKAHDLFRKATEIDPYHEQIWLWLASVVETDEDQHVCFENVLELNPSHPTALRQLQLLDQKALEETLQLTSPEKNDLSRRRKIFRLLLIVIIAASITAIMLAEGII